MTGRPPDAFDKMFAVLERVSGRAMDSAQEDFRLTNRWLPESPHVVHFFGKAYWWDRMPDGRLTLLPAVWLNPPARPAR